MNWCYSYIIPASDSNIKIKSKKSDGLKIIYGAAHKKFTQRSIVEFIETNC